MINWFKDNFKSRDYQKELRKARSPRIKSNNVDPLEFVGLERAKKNDDADTWKNINKDWQQPNSVHSVNDDQDDKCNGRANLILIFRELEGPRWIVVA